MNCSVKVFAPSVTAGLPAPGLLPPRFLLSLPPPQAATPTLSATAASAAVVLRIDDPLTCPPLSDCSFSLRSCSARRLQPRVVPGPPLGRPEHRRLPAQPPGREQVLDG